MSIPVLAIDAGNTRIKWGLHDGREWVLRGAFKTTDIAGSHVFIDAMKASDLDCVVLSNVAGPSVAAAIKHQVHDWHKPICCITAEARRCGVVNHYNHPAQLGSDRWAALIAAQTAAAGAPRAQLVVMAGTALTVDALGADGYFLGGIIVPGLKLMHRALHGGTAQLPSTSGQYQTFPKCTGDAISSGATEACAGAIQRMYTHLSVQAGHSPHCIGSGGVMSELAPHLPFPILIDDHLVLEGLVIIANTA